MDKILFIDDEINILEGYKRTLRKKFKFDLASNAKEGLEILQKSGPYAVVVSDYRMPDMNGVEFLSAVKDNYPNTVRIMLTGQTELNVSVKAVNEGNVFQFLTKPCDTQALTTVIDNALKQYRLLVAEKEILEQTLHGSVKILVDILSLSKPKIFSRASRVKRLVKKIVQHYKLEDTWLFELSSMLAEIGFITLSEELVEKVYKDEPMTNLERDIYKKTAEKGKELLINIPRLQDVAEIIGDIHKTLNDYSRVDKFSDFTHNEKASQILKVCMDFDILMMNKSMEDSFAILESKRLLYNAEIVNLLSSIKNKSNSNIELLQVELNELKSNMVVAKDIINEDGMLLVAKGQELTSPIILALQSNYTTKKIGAIFIEDPSADEQH